MVWHSLWFWRLHRAGFDSCFLRALGGTARRIEAPRPVGSTACTPARSRRAAAVEYSFIEILFNTPLLYRKFIGYSKQYISIKSSGIAELAVPNRIVIETALLTKSELR